MHLAAQEDHVPIAEILVNYKSEIDATTKVCFITFIYTKKKKVGLVPESNIVLSNNAASANSC
jgi:hypothetical protein